ncbi:MAG: hypothetical protein WHX52_00215 [Anaerolineae bacterium]
MDSPFLQHVGDIFSGLKGRKLTIAAVIWGMLLLVALACAFGLIKLPGGKAPAAPAKPPATLPTPQATATQQGFTVLPTPTPQSGTPAYPKLPWGDFGYGVAANAIIMPDYTLNQIAHQLKFTWVKQQVRWDHFSPGPGQMDWSGYDVMVEFAHERNLKVLLSVVGAPAWSLSYRDANPQAAPPDDITLYINFLGEMVDRYKGKIHAIEVWNEQNLDREWDTAQGVNAASYVEMLRLAYQAIKSRDPSIIVISGALSPTGASATDSANPNRVIYMDDFVYFQQMIDAGFLNYADCVGAHHNGINMPPDVAWNEGYNDPTAKFRGPFDNPDHSWSFKSTLWGYHDMIQKAGFNKPLCVTEFGWATSEGFGATPVGFEFADDNTLEEQAQWTVQAFQLMREWGFVHLAFLWNLDYSYKGPGPSDPNAPYAILDMQGAARPAYSALAEMPKIP